MDALLEGIGRFIANFIFGTILELIFYWPGWLMLRLVTFGKYPPAQREKHNRAGVAWFGLIVIVIGIASYNHFS